MRFPALATLVLLALAPFSAAQDFANPEAGVNPSTGPTGLLHAESVSLSGESAIQPQTYEVLREQEASADAAGELAVRVREQGTAFSREFARLNPFDKAFPEKFAALLSAYPLAAEDPFSAKLIERGRRMLVATKRGDILPESTPADARRALEAEMESFKKNYAGSDLLNDPAYIELKRRLDEISKDP